MGCIVPILVVFNYHIKPYIKQLYWLVPLIAKEHTTAQGGHIEYLIDVELESSSYVS